MTTNAELIAIYQRILDELETARGLSMSIKEEISRSVGRVIALNTDVTETQGRLAAVNDSSSGRLSEAEGALSNTTRHLEEDSQKLASVADFVEFNWLPGMAVAIDKVREQLAVTLS